MTSKISGVLGFITGAAIGGAVAWYYAREKYARITEEEIASVKAAYAKKREVPVEQETPAEKTALAPGKVPDKPSITDYAKRITDAGYTDYSRTVKPETATTTPGEVPYVISPDEFGEIEEYTKVSLTYFADGVLSDEYGEVVDDVEEIVGDALNHFGEYEDDSVFVRNDAKRCDYEILKDLREFDEFLETLPPKT